MYEHKIAIGEHIEFHADITHFACHNQTIYLLEKEFIELHSHKDRTKVIGTAKLTDVIETILEHEYLHSVLFQMFGSDNLGDQLYGKLCAIRLDKIHTWKIARYKRMTFIIRKRKKKPSAKLLKRRFENKIKLYEHLEKTIKKKLGYI